MKSYLASLAAAGLIVLSVAAHAADDKGAPAPVATPAPAEKPLTAADQLTASAGATKWDVILDKSAITFHGKQMGNDFDGVIPKFKADISFDENHLDTSKATVDIDITSIDAKDPERNKSIKGSDWFDTDRFPTARFETTKFTKTGDDAFTADGNLTIHGITVPIQLPFKLAHEAVGFGQDRVIMTGTVTLDRSKFQLGTGDWADPTVIANEVPVDVKITATAATSNSSAPPQAPAGNKPASP